MCIPFYLILCCFSSSRNNVWILCSESRRDFVNSFEKRAKRSATDEYFQNFWASTKWNFWRGNRLENLPYSEQNTFVVPTNELHFSLLHSTYSKEYVQPLKEKNDATIFGHYWYPTKFQVLQIKYLGKIRYFCMP